MQQFLAARGIPMPQQVSLVCTNADPVFAWCMPPISRFRWDSGPMVQRIARWAETVSRDRKDVKQASARTELIEGGTTGTPREV